LTLLRLARAGNSGGPLKNDFLTQIFRGGEPMKENGMGAWMIKLLSLLPYVVSGIQQIHGDAKSGAEKKQLALEALGLSTSAAAAIDPAQAPVIEAVKDLASNAIDGVKSVYNASKKQASAVIQTAPTAGDAIPANL
jgi:hypothetical protein